MNATPKILIVEDEPDLAELIADYVRASAYDAKIIGDGQLALLEIQKEPPSLIVLDLMLPGLDGISICKQVREFSQVPIIMVTAKVEEIDRLLGLEIGADDYLCKPFSPRELVARIKVILRRIPDNMSSSNKETKVQIDAAAFAISINSKVMDLTRSEYLIFCALLQHQGQVFSRQQLLDIANQDALDVTDRAVDSHIKNLRKKIHHILPDSNPILSIYGLGYRFDGFD
ncbi:MAG: response regulator [Undibacterium sp.]|nr:response regulator [Undibacterium sp.]